MAQQDADLASDYEYLTCFLVEKTEADLEAVIDTYVHADALPAVYLVEQKEADLVAVPDTHGPNAIVQGAIEYRMRGFDTTLARIVYWTSPSIDKTASFYLGPGPVTDIVISDLVCD